MITKVTDSIVDQRPIYYSHSDVLPFSETDEFVVYDIPKF